MFKFNTFSELVNGAIIQEDALLAHKAEKKRKAQRLAHLAALLKGFVLCSQAHSEPPSSTNLHPGHHNSSGAIGHLSTRSHRG